MTRHHALTQAIVTAHEAERGGDGVRGRRRRRTGGVLALRRSASRMGSPARPGKVIWFCKSSSSLWCPLICETVVPKTAPGLAQCPLSPSSVLGATMFRQRTSPAAPQPPHGQAGERPGGSQVAQAVEGAGWDASRRGVRGEDSLCSSRCGLPSPRTGCPGELCNLNGSAPRALGNRQDQRQQESCRFVRFHVVSGQTCFQPA